MVRMAARTLQRRLKVRGLPPAVRLLAWATALHATWHLEVNGESVKEAAAAAGFPTRASFTSFVRRHANCTVSELSRAGMFVRMLQFFSTELLPATAQVTIVSPPSDAASFLSDFPRAAELSR
jgi:AraC-like DNA-binding protein